MTYKIFKQLYSEAAEYSNFDMYLSERGWQEWMDSYNDSDKIALILQNIYNLQKSDSPVRFLINLTGLSQAKFASAYMVSVKTVEAWLAGTNNTPIYFLLLAFAVYTDYGII